MRRNYEKGRIVTRHSMMRYDVLIPGREHPWTKVGTLNPAWFDEGETVVVGFLEGNPQIPFIATQKPWIQSLQAAREQIIQLYHDWICYGANYLRTWSWTRPEGFHWQSAGSRAALLSLATNVRYETIPSDLGPPQGRGERSAISANAVLTDQGGSSFSSLDVTSILATIDAEHTYSSAVSIVRRHGQLLVEIQAFDEVYDEDSGDLTVSECAYLARLNASDLTKPALAVEWVVRLDEAYPNRLTRTDRIGDCLVFSRENEMGGVQRRCVVLLQAQERDDHESLFSRQLVALHVDWDGGEVSADPISYQILPTPNETLASEARPLAWADESSGRIWVEGASIVFGWNDGAPVVALDWELATTAPESGAGVLKAVMGNRLIYSGTWETYETVVDYPMRTTRDQFGEVYETSRIERSRGHSLFRGTVVVDAVTGALVTRNAYPGTEPAGQLEGSRFDALWESYWDHEIPAKGYGSRPIPGGGPLDEEAVLIPEEQAYSMLDRLRVWRGNQFFYQAGAYPEPEGGYPDPDETHPLIALGRENVTKQSPYPPRVIDGVTYNQGQWDEWEARRDQFMQAQAELLNAAARSRPNGANGLRGDYLRISPYRGAFRQTSYWHEELESRAPYDPPIISDQYCSWTSVLGPSTPPGGTPRLWLDWGNPSGPTGLTSAIPRAPHDYAQALTRPRYEYWDEARQEMLSNSDPDPTSYWRGAESISGAAEYDSGDFDLWAASVAVGTSIRVHRKIVWIGRGTWYDRVATPLQHWRESPACNTGRLVVCGPEGGEYYDLASGTWVNRPLVWRAETNTGAQAWISTLPGSGGAVYGQAGTPIALDLGEDGICTLTPIILAGVPKIVIHSSTGEILGTPDGTADMLEAMFDRTRLVRQALDGDTQQWGPPT